jgi:hypothetical protein
MGWEGERGRTNREVAETALSSEVFALGLSCDVVTRRKFVRFVGSAVQIDAPAIAIDSNVENFIVKNTQYSCFKKNQEIKSYQRRKYEQKSFFSRNKIVKMFQNNSRASNPYICATHPGFHRCHHRWLGA